MKYSNRFLQNKRISLILFLYFGLALGVTNAQQSQTFNANGSGATGSIQTFTIPQCATTITVVAYGAQGGATGGLGAEIQGTFSYSPGTVLNILVGQAGGSSDNSHGSGGGGSFVTLASNDTILIIAGGGGGHGSSGIDASSNGSASRAGQSPAGSGTATAGGGGGAAAGVSPGGIGCNNGANQGGSYWSGGGGGFCGNGGNYYAGNSFGGYSYLSGGNGGTPAPAGGDAYGGYGGGGGDGDRGAGGGGYSGGAGGTSNSTGGGGGGSYNAGTNQINTAGVQSGNGLVIIYYNSGATAAGNVVKSVSCYGENNGKASAITNGLPPYTYSWSPGGKTTDTISGLSAGVYTVTVSGSCGGSATATVTITQPASALSVSAGVINNVLCNGDNNGVASSFTSGGTSPYTYLWTPAGGTGHNATGLTAGNYTLNVTDNHGCTASASTTITQPNALLVSANVSANVSCHGGADGGVSSGVTFGTTPYTYFWSNGGTMDMATGLTAGTYSLKVTDNNGCTGSAVATITQPAAFVASASVISNVLCYGGNNGSASSGVSGGASPYNYFWSNGETNANAAALPAGTFTLTATDNCGSSATVLVTVTQPAALGGTATVVENVNCNGASNGCASVSVSGGTPPYAYQWSDVNNQITPTACGLTAGTYTVSITDNNGCTGVIRATITQPSAISVSATSSIDRGNCTGGASVSVSGGVAPYSYAWANGNTTNSISGQCGDATYCCTVTDAMGCQQNACVTIKKLSTGIANVNGGTQGITVYPNPNNGQFTIVIASEAKQSQDVVEIYNVLGERVYSQYLIPNSQFLINLSNQPNGIYLYRVISESGSLIGEGKIMLQK